MQFSEGALYNTLLDLHNSPYHTQPHPINVNYFILFFLQKKSVEQKKKEQDDLNQLFKPVIGQKVSAGTV